MERKDNNSWKKIELSINKFLSNYKDFKTDFSENSVTDYVEDTLNNISLPDYISLLKNEAREIKSIYTHTLAHFYVFCIN